MDTALDIAVAASAGPLPILSLSRSDEFTTNGFLNTYGKVLRFC